MSYMNNNDEIGLLGFLLFIIGSIGALLLAAHLVGCVEGDSPKFLAMTDANVDADTGTEDDTDTGTEEDTDTDTGTEDDTDTGTEEDTDIETDTGTEDDTDTGTEEDTDTETDTGTEEDTDTATEEDTDTILEPCPWECVRFDGYYTCGKFDDTPEHVRNWAFACEDGFVCCQPVNDDNGINEHCNDYDDTECQENDCDGTQNTDRYCNGAGYPCCEI